MTAPARTAVVVAVTDDPSSGRALAWGADYAHRRRLPLRLVLVRGLLSGRRTRGPARRGGDRRDRVQRAAAQPVLSEAVAFARHRHPRLEVSALIVEDAPVPALREQARTAAAMVLARGRPRGPGRWFATASAALQVIAHAPCPVVIAGPREFTGRRPPFFVVGVDVGWDGRRHCPAAVSHAFEQAARHGATLRVVYVWHSPLLGVLDEQAAVGECRRLLSDMVAGWRVTHPTVDVRHAVLRGYPAQVLARESADALALVVGVRGHGRAMRPLHGSVVSRALRHAHCPVVAVPPSAACGHTHGRPVGSLLPRWAHKTVGRHTGLLARLVRAQLGRAARAGRHRHTVTASARPADVALNPAAEPPSPREGTSPPAGSSR
ncbi:universal stress protein [Streptomyces longisporoflavus]|uniref:universal stress protein n=1 Tax=Streptomyces longisporoflavus TaxID=28044 RepID=UPI00167CC077|nr:universal stress protein [Streptomyces longisporoflavus]